VERKGKSAKTGKLGIREGGGGEKKREKSPLSSSSKDTIWVGGELRG